VAGFGIYGQRVALAPPKKPGTTTKPSVLDAYGKPIAQGTANQGTVPQGITDQMNATQNLQVGYTPAEQLAMRNRIRATDTAQTVGSTNRLAEMMAARGLSGSGAEVGAYGDLLRGQAGNRQNALSNLDISNAQLANQNIYQRAGMANQLAGLGEQGRQFNAGQYNNMFQYGTSFDEQKRLAEQGRSDYYKQLQAYLNQLGLPGATGGGNTGSYGRLGG
jgi:hypothetical protein